VLFEDGVEVRAAEAEGADAGAARLVTATLPVAQLAVHEERRVGEVRLRVRDLDVEARGDLAVVKRERRLQHAGRAGRALEVTDVRLDRSERDAALRNVERRHDVSQALDLDDVADARGRPVPFHQRVERGPLPGDLPGPLHREALPHGVRRRDALALAVAGPADAPDHGVDAVAVALGVLEALDDEHRGALAHDEAVGVRVVGTGPRRRQCADLAELHERRRRHVGVDAARDDDIEVPLREPLDGGRHRGHGRGARRVGHEVRSVQVEDGGDAARDDVRELARHRVFRDVGDLGANAGQDVFRDRVALIRVERGEGRAGLEVGQVLRREDAERRHVVLVAAHGVADDDGRALAIERPLGVTEVEERLPGRGDRPLLGAIHRVADLRRDGHLPVEWLPREVADPAADLRVGLVRRLRVRVVVSRGVPPLLRRLGDAVPSGGEVVPQRGNVGSAGQNGADADDGSGSTIIG
jgi:hypothetical protein